MLADTLNLALEAHPSGDSYIIEIAVPAGPAPAGGWPAIVLLDAHGCFATAVEALTRMARRPDATGVQPMVVIGVSNPEGAADTARRQRDFTTPPPGVEPRYEASHGAPAFLAFLEDEVLPQANKICPINLSKLTLFGHSLAGYFVLWVMLEGGERFSRFIAASPSIWWDKERLFVAAGSDRGAAWRILITVGAWEDDLPPWQAARTDSAQVRDRRASRSMVANARALCDLITTCGGDAQFRLLEEEDHASIVSTSIPRALRLASMA